MLSAYRKILVYTVLISIAEGCPPGWQLFKNSCYHVSSEEESWMDGMKMCEIHGGTLVQIETAEEDEFIAQQMRIHSIRNTWLGGSDWAVEGSWVWEPDGKILQYSNFAPGKPNNFFGENCLDKEQSLYYQWNDEDCDTDAYYICEKQNVIGNLIG